MITRIARRFVFNRRVLDASDNLKTSSFASFVALIAITGLTLGVTALLVVTSVMNGFEREMKSALTAFHGHIILFSRGEPIAAPDKMFQELKQIPGVTGVSPYVFAEVMLSAQKHVSGSMVEGVDRATIDQVSLIGKKITSGRLPVGVLAKDPTAVPEITLGNELARKLKASVGDTILLTVPFGKKSSDEPDSAATALVRKLKVVGIVQVGMYDYDSKYSLVEISDLQKILGAEMLDKVNAFKILTNDPQNSLKITNELNERYVYPMRARDWSSLNRNLFYAIRLEKVVISIILMAIVLVASFNIISTLMMMVHDKKRQISMLKALGWGPRQTFSVFLLIGAVMSVLGTVLGLGLGRALCALVAWKSIIDLPADIYVLSRLPIEIRPLEWVLICVMTIAIAVLATLWPSYRVSRESPVEGLRYE